MDLIQLHLGTEELVLQGTGMEPPVRGTIWLPAVGEPAAGEAGAQMGTVEERLEVQLEGPAGAIEGCMSALGRLLAGADDRFAGGLFLEARAAKDGKLQRSRVLRGAVALGALGADRREAGSQGLVLRLVREDAWEAADWTALTLRNPNGAETAGLKLTNHYDADAGHVHFADVDGSEVEGDLPARPLLELWHYTTPEKPLSALVGQSALVDRTGAQPEGGSYSLAREAEACETYDEFGVTYTTVADASCSGGYARQMSWNGTATVRLLGYTANSLQSLWMAGRAFRPVLRLRGTVMGRLWGVWDVAYYSTVGGTVEQVVYRSDGGWLARGQEFILGPALFLPPYRVDVQGSSCPYTKVILRVQGEGMGPHSLTVDSFGLLPLDGWRQYESWARAPGLEVQDDGVSGAMRSPFRAVQTHLADGPGFVLYPGKNSRFYVFAWEESLNKPVPIGQEFKMCLRYRARRKTL